MMESQVANVPASAVGETNNPPIDASFNRPCGNCGQYGCPGCGNNVSRATQSSSFVYALSRVEARFPNLSVEKEFAQATSRGAKGGGSDQETMHRVLSQADNVYLARQLCWVLTIGGSEAYILLPRDSDDVRTLLSTLRPAPRATDIDVVVGQLGPFPPPSFCNGLQVPTVQFTQVYSFDVASFVKALPRPSGANDKQWTASAEDALSRVLRRADNLGTADEDRAINYLAMRYPPMYSLVAEMHSKDAALLSIEGRRSQLSGTRRLVDVIFAFRNRQTDFVEKMYVRVDVTELFPFLVTNLSTYYER